MPSLVGSEMCIRDRVERGTGGGKCERWSQQVLDGVEKQARTCCQRGFISSRPPCCRFCAGPHYPPCCPWEFGIRGCCHTGLPRHARIPASNETSRVDEKPRFTKKSSASMKMKSRPAAIQDTAPQDLQNTPQALSLYSPRTSLDLPSGLLGAPHPRLRPRPSLRQGYLLAALRVICA